MVEKPLSRRDIRSKRNTTGLIHHKLVVGVSQHKQFCQKSLTRYVERRPYVEIKAQNWNLFKRLHQRFQHVRSRTVRIFSRVWVRNCHHHNLLPKGQRFFSCHSFNHKSKFSQCFSTKSKTIRHQILTTIARNERASNSHMNVHQIPTKLNYNNCS